MESHPAPPAPHALAFVQQLLGTGLTLIRLLDDLVDACVASSGSDESESAEALIEMLAGTVGVRLRRVPAADFDRAAELMEMTMEAVLADLRMAAEVAGRRKNGYSASAA
jgi:hypothetical protein